MKDYSSLINPRNKASNLTSDQDINDDDDDGGIQVEDKTEQLSNDAKDWALASAKLRDKYKNQKWYQF